MILVNGVTNENTTTEDTYTNTTVIEDYAGEVINFSRTGSITILNDDEYMTFMLDDDAKITLNHGYGTFADIEVGDKVILYVEGSYIKEVYIDKIAGQTVTNLYVESIIQTRDEYVLMVNDGHDVEVYYIEFDILTMRDGKAEPLSNFKVGDKLSINFLDGEVISIVAEGDNADIEGIIQMIAIKYEPEITIMLANGELVTYIVTQDSTLYDEETGEYISIDELKLYSTVSVIADSREIIELSVEEYAGSLKYKGVIQSATPSGDYIEVLVEYDVLTDTSLFIKKIYIPSSVNIIIDKRTTYRSQLEAGMEVLITYDSYGDITPREIFVLD